MQRILLNSIKGFFALSLIAFMGYANANEQLVPPVDALRFSVLTTAESSGSLEAMVVAGGNWTTKRKLVHTAVLIQHPKGDFLFDSGIGKDVEAQMTMFNFLESQLFKIENIHPARSQLAEHQYDIERLFGIIPSHMHWDHASGLEDFAGIPIWIQQASLDEALKGQPPAFILSQYDSADLAWHTITLNEQSYQGFKRSLDIFGDQSAVLVDLSGHTKGQLGLFLNMPSGKRYFFIGDTTWSKIGITRNKPRPVFVDWLVGVDSNYEKNRQVIQAIHQLSRATPELVIVPAHDELVMQNLPRYPDFSN